MAIQYRIEDSFIEQHLVVIWSASHTRYRAYLVVDHKLEHKAKAGANLGDHKDGQSVPEGQASKRQDPPVSNVESENQPSLEIIGRSPVHHLKEAEQTTSE